MTVKLSKTYPCLDPKAENRHFNKWKLLKYQDKKKPMLVPVESVYPSLLYFFISDFSLILTHHSTSISRTDIIVSVLSLMLSSY